MSKTIQVSCEAADLVDYRKIQAFQGELKELSKENFEKLKKSILKRGVTSPINLWKDKGKLWNLDGHQRVRLFAELEKLGFKIPKVPVAYVKAKSLKEAKEILLSNVSQYGRVNPQGLYEFSVENGFAMEDLADFDIPNIDMPDFFEEFFIDGTTDENDVAGLAAGADASPDQRVHSSHVRMVQLFFDDKNHPEFLEKCNQLAEHFGKDNITDTVMEAIREVHSSHFSN